MADWTVLNTFFNDNDMFITKHHIESYNEFVSEKIPSIIKSLNPFRKIEKNCDNKVIHEIDVFIGGIKDVKVRFECPSTHDKKLFPNEARLKNLSYKSAVFCDIDILTKNRETGKTSMTTVANRKIADIPVMLGSKLCNTFNMDKDKLRDVGECPYDKGGYFIINGKEKVIIAQERIATNKLFVARGKPKSGLRPNLYEAIIRCTREGGAIFPKTHKFRVTPEKRIQVIVPNPRNRIKDIKENIPLFVLFRALGIESDKSILSMLLDGNIDDPSNKKCLDFLYFSIIDNRGVYTQKQALEYISTDTTYLKSVILDDLLPSMDTPYTKALFLGYITKALLRVCIGIDPVTNKDYYGYKRVDVSGFLLAGIFRDFYNTFRRKCMSELDQAYQYGTWKTSNDLDKVIEPNKYWKIFPEHHIGNSIDKSMRGKWGANDDDKNAKALVDGIVQDLSRLSYVGYLSHLRRVQTPIDSGMKIIEPRRLQSSQWGMICPSESPDGASIGLSKNLAMLCHITPDVPSSTVTSVLKEDPAIKFVQLCDVFQTDSARTHAIVLVNNNWVGIICNPRETIGRLRDLRGKGELHHMTSMSWDIINNKIDIFTDAGRCCRPLLVVTNNTIKRPNPSASWGSLVKERVVEYIDVSESNNCLIAMTEADLRDSPNTYTHCEIHPSTIFAVLTLNIPFSNHNAAARNVFSGAQGKQALGIYSTQFRNRMDRTGLVLHYPQRCLVDTRYMEYMNNNNLPNGENAIVAIMCYSGYNQEDSIILNKAAVERGMFNMTYFKTIVDTEATDALSGTKTIFGNPEKYTKEGIKVDNFGKRYGNYSTIDNDGYPVLNSIVEEGDVYLGKMMVKPERTKTASIVDTKNVNVMRYEDQSLVADKTMKAIVDQIFVYSENNLKTCKIRFRKVRQPVLGDKHASRHAQKGVIGMIMPPESMPFTKDGLVPDLIINPHAIPTRQTIGHLIECLCSKVGCLSGKYIDGTPFCNEDIDYVKDELAKHGYERNGDEIMYNGITGEQIMSTIFIGPTYMQRLKHMVDDKINYRCRNESPYETLTRQPVQGRARGGGMRVGEMESWVVTSHGMASFLRESMMERSDEYMYNIDKVSGVAAISSVNPRNHFVKSQSNEENRFASVNVPFASKLFVQELNTIGLDVRFMLDNVDEEKHVVATTHESDGEISEDEAYIKPTRRKHADDGSDDEDLNDDENEINDMFYEEVMGGIDDDYGIDYEDNNEEDYDD